MLFPHDTKVDALRQCPLFAELSRDELQEMAKTTEDLEVDTGKVLCREGEPAQEFFVIIEGEAEATKDGEALRTMGPGDFFGEIGALTGGNRTANVVATDDIEVLEVTSETLKALLDLPAMNALINSKMTERLARTAASPDFPRLQRLDQGDLADLRRRRPKGRAGATA
jgi:CRP-like cAMP-binding protein